MIVILKNNPSKAGYNALVKWLGDMNVEVHEIEGSTHTVLGLVGDTSSIDLELVRSMEIVQDVKRVQEPYKQASRKFHPDDSVISTGDTHIGGGDLHIIAGPCSIESEEQICSVARDVKAAGATLLRGGAFKPRTSPYTFQGLRKYGIELLVTAKQETGLPIVTEIMDISQLECFDDVDVIQVGARNMQNFELLKELGHTDKPILLKRGLSSTLQELLMSAEYILSGGNHKVILCERGIRTFETATRNTLDISAIPLLHEMSHLPVIVDPSHATGIARLVTPMSVAAAAAGADGLIVEVHNDPAKALCDGAQSLTPEQFAQLVHKVNAVRPVASK
ncbi:MAG: 3-deoxy-7-phosphoheptulonate synthase [Candidatus Heteroscillospira sp.]|jgi:3-deoxy-7-phosphoheptulonate synthase